MRRRGLLCQDKRGKMAAKTCSRLRIHHPLSQRKRNYNRLSIRTMASALRRQNHRPKNHEKRHHPRRILSRHSSEQITRCPLEADKCPQVVPDTYFPLISINFCFSSFSMLSSSCSATRRLWRPSSWMRNVSSRVVMRLAWVFFNVSISTRPRSFSFAVSIVFVFSISAFFRSSSLVVLETCFCASTA